MSENQLPEWLREGMRVVVYTVGGRSVFTTEDYGVTVTTIKKVSRTSFTVKEEREPRFRNADQTSARQGGTSFASYERRVISYDSPEADYLMAHRKRSRAIDAATRAAHGWDTTSGRTDQEKIRAVAEAFAAIPEPATKPEGFR